MSYKTKHEYNKGIIASLCMMLVWGILMTFLVPAWQTPDELMHLSYIGDSIENPSLVNILYQDMWLDYEDVRLGGGHTISEATYRQAMVKEPSYEMSACMPGGLKLSVIKHLPATLGLMLGLVLRLPTFWVMELAELFAFGFYFGMCMLALKLLPVKKEAMLVVMTFPMGMQQAASINYDSVLLPLIYVFIAYIVYLRMEKESCGLPQLFICLLLLSVIAYIKLPYALIGLMMLIIPEKKTGISLGKWKLPLIIGLVLLLVLGVYLARENTWIKLILGLASEPMQTLRILYRTVESWGGYLLIGAVGNFGYLDSQIPLPGVLFVYVILLGLVLLEPKREKGYALKTGNRLVLWLVFVAVCLLVAFSMVHHTIMVVKYGSEWAEGTYNIREELTSLSYIGGLQGRYFLPVIPVACLAIPETRQLVGYERKAVVRQVLLVGYEAVAMIMTCCILVNRYF